MRLPTLIAALGLSLGGAPYAAQQPKNPEECIRACRIARAECEKKARENPADHHDGERKCETAERKCVEACRGSDRPLRP